jgi:hypothetical protein
MGADNQAESILDRNRLSAIAKIKHLPSAAWPVFPEPNRNHAPGVSSIRASSIRAIAIMTNAVETNRILDSPLSCWCVTPPCLPNCMESFCSQFVLRARGLRHHDDTGSIRTKNRL